MSALGQKTCNLVPPIMKRNCKGPSPDSCNIGLKYGKNKMKFGNNINFDYPGAPNLSYQCPDVYDLSGLIQSHPQQLFYMY